MNEGSGVHGIGYLLTYIGRFPRRDPGQPEQALGRNQFYDQRGKCSDSVSRVRRRGEYLGHCRGWNGDFPMAWGPFC